MARPTDPLLQQVQSTTDQFFGRNSARRGRFGTSRPNQFYDFQNNAPIQPQAPAAPAPPTAAPPPSYSRPDNHWLRNGADPGGSSVTGYDTDGDGFPDSTAPNKDGSHYGTGDLTSSGRSLTASDKNPGNVSSNGRSLGDVIAGVVGQAIGLGTITNNNSLPNVTSVGGMLASAAKALAGHVSSRAGESSLPSRDFSDPDGVYSGDGGIGSSAGVSASDRDASRSDSGYGAFNKGGLVHKNDLGGPNPTGPDDGYAALDAGEFVIRKKAVSHYGPAIMKALNDMKFDKAVLEAFLDDHRQF